MTLHDSHCTLPDDQLVRLAVRDERAFETLVKRHAPAIHRLAATTVGPGAADDVVQEVLISLHKSLRTFRGDAQFSTWLHRVTLNACYQALKARQAIPFDQTAEPVAPHNPTRTSEQADIREKLAAALHTLPRDQREAVTLREVSGLEYAQIADITGTELGTVKSRISRGRAALREWLTKAGLGP